MYTHLLYKNKTYVPVSEDEVKGFLQLRQVSKKVVSIDTETNGLNPYTNDLLLISISNFNGEALCIDYRGVSPSLFQHIREFLSDTSIHKIFHNAKFDYKFLKINFKCDITSIHDTMILSNLLYAGLQEKHNLAVCLERELGISLDKSLRIDFTKFTRTEVIPEKYLIYSIKDVLHLYNLYSVLWEKGFAIKNSIKLLTKELVDLEENCISVYGDIELNGIKIDTNLLDETIIQPNKINLEIQTKALNDLLIQFNPTKINKSIDIFGTITTTSINWDSNAEVLKFYNSQVPTSYRVDNVNAKTLEDILVKIKDEDLTNSSRFFYIKTLINLILKYREIKKILSTYGDNLKSHVNPITGRIHCDFIQFGADTGRVSCTNPNLQNMPADKTFRRVFVPEKGNLFCIADYSGQELRILAYGSKDKTMIEAFKNGEDVHSKIATIMNGIEVSKTVNKELRDIQKNINFGLAYGAGAERFVSLFGSIERSKEEMDKFFKLFPKIKNFLEDNAYIGKTKGKSYTFFPFTRTRNYPEILNNKTPSNSEVSRVGRASKNHVIQGTAADITKLATLLISLKLKELNKELDLQSKIVNQIHDEIIVEFKDINNNSEVIAEVIKSNMLKAFNTSCPNMPCEIDLHIAPYWKK